MSMTTQAEQPSDDAPKATVQSSPTFAGLIRHIDAHFKRSRSPVAMIGNENLRDLVTCIREQYAALQQMAYVFDSDDSPSPAIKKARATLAKWKLP